MFGIETAALLACDAEIPTNGVATDARSSGRFAFLYRSRRGQYFHLTAPREWHLVAQAEARSLYDALPQKLVSPEDAFAAPDRPRIAASEEDDPRTYTIVRNDRWDFSLHPEEAELPRGWTLIGFRGSRRECLEYIEETCVFGVPNPGMM